MKTYLFGFAIAVLGFIGATQTALAASTSTVEEAVAGTSIPALLQRPIPVPVATTTLAVSRVESEKIVRAYFANIPDMIEVARCESGFRQFTDAGNVFRDYSGDMIGVFQFYESAHTVAAKALGFDLTTLDGNMKYARHLYEAQGISPWQSCAPTSVIPVQNFDTQTKLKIEIIKQLIVLLQQLLVIQQSR